jgi:DNA-binding NtrC family response regulator
MLVIDDEDGPRAAVQIVFKHQFDVLAIDSSPLALVACELRCFDVAISDIRRAGISGLDCLEEMRRMGCGAPVIILTAYVTRDRIRRAFALGAYDVIDKPFSIRELQQAVAMAMGMGFAE